MYNNDLQCLNCNFKNLAQFDPNTSQTICKCQPLNVQVNEQGKINQPCEIVEKCDSMQKVQQIDQNTEAQNDQKNNKGGSMIFANIYMQIKEHNLPFNEQEYMAIQDILNLLMINHIIRGEKTQTIICVVEYMISQLSGNPELNKLSFDQIRELNNLKFDTAKKLWNIIINDNQLMLNQISKWQGSRPISELQIIQ